jgi:DNA polymerase II large subunit
MKLTCALLLCLFSSSTFAKKSLKAHSHDGELEVKIVVNADGKTAAIEMEATGDSLLGFESNPKSTFQKQVYSSIKSLWETSLTSSLVQFDKKVDCAVNTTTFNLNFEEEKEEHHHGHKKEHAHVESHSEILAKAEISCASTLNKSKVAINLKKAFNDSLVSLYKKNGKKRKSFVKKIDLEVMPVSGKSFVKKTSSSSFAITL